jgi:hypothetical protein
VARFRTAGGGAGAAAGGSCGSRPVDTMSVVRENPPGIAQMARAGAHPRPRLTPGKNLNDSGMPGSRWGTEKVFEQGFGRCWDFSDCFVTLSRAAGVPSRQVAGWLFGGSGHVWAEYYREDVGWQQVDPTGGGMLQCGLFHIPHFVSENGEMPLLYVQWPSFEIVESR